MTIDDDYQLPGLKWVMQSANATLQAFNTKQKSNTRATY